jgi:hypothetical protein
MAELSPTDLRAILAAEKADALAAVSASKLSKERSDAMDYYNGDVSADIPDEVGRSRAVSSDVADTIEGLMPSLMEIFCSGDEVVKFSPVGPEDVEAAEQETDYVNHVFMQQNPGFLVLYSFIKDALLQKVGIVKVWTEKEEEEKRESYYSQSPDALAMILQQPNIELIEHTENEDGTHDVTIVCTKSYKCHKVEPVPPEEFGISRRAKSIKDATYCFHETVSTVGDLTERGYDEAQVKALPSTTGNDSSESSSRDTVDESSGSGDEGLNTAARPVNVTEHYIRMDYRGDGKAALYRVVTGGEQGEVLKRNGKPDVEQVEMAPFAAMTPVIVTHRFFGRSIADLVMDIQRIKSVLVRGLLDNMYMHNRPRPVVSQQGVTDTTLDDLLVSRHGALIRVKGDPAAAIQWQVVPDITGSVYPALEYMDATREWRTGVTRQGQGIDASALQNQSATAVNQQFTAAQARMKLIARIFAETGIRDLFLLLHAEIRRHGDEAQTVRLRNQWVQVDPREWKSRSDLTIDVGLGTGGKQQELANLMQLMNIQVQALEGGKSNLVTDKNLYNSAKEYVKLIGKKDVDTFFSDPEAVDEQTGEPLNPPPEPPPDPKMLEVQLKQQELEMKGQELAQKAQLDQMADERKAEIERIQAEADIATQDRKAQTELQLAQQKFELERELKLMDHQLKREAQQADLEMKRELHSHSIQSSQMGMVASAEAHEHKMAEAKAKTKEKAKT